MTPVGGPGLCAPMPVVAQHFASIFCQMMEILNQVTPSSQGVCPAGGVSDLKGVAALEWAHGQSLQVASGRRVTLAHDR